MQVGQHATLSRDDHGLAEDLRAEDEGRPDVGPDRRAGGVTGGGRSQYGGTPPSHH